MNKKLKKCISAISSAAFIMTAFPTVMEQLPNVSAANLLTAEFETTNDSFTGRGEASVAWTSDKAYSVDCSLFVADVLRCGTARHVKLLRL